MVNDHTNAQILDVIRQKLKEEMTLLLQLAPRSKILQSGLRDAIHLVNTSTIIQFGDWSRAGFEYMARKYFEGKQMLAVTGGNDEEETEEELNVEHLEQVVLCMIEMHQDSEIAAQGYFQETGHQVYVSPQLFENFIRTYKKLLKKRETQLTEHFQRFNAGYEGIRKCLRDTEETQEELSKKAPLLVKRQTELENIIDDYRLRHDQIQEKKALLMKKEVEVNFELDEAMSMQQSCDKRFKAVVPKFIEANEGLSQITKQQIEELKVIKEPNKTLLNLCKCVCVIMKIPA